LSPEEYRALDFETKILEMCSYSTMPNMEKPLAWFTDFSKWIAEAAGHPISFSVAVLTIIVWAGG